MCRMNLSYTREFSFNLPLKLMIGDINWFFLFTKGKILF